ncbi:MAG: nitroreductase [Oscillospiraceae bacterium]|nr:nitroreductase [Oscillospiraceae bacterium]
MKEFIQKRKSVRKFDMTPLDTATMDKVRAELEKLIPLFPNIKYCTTIVEKTKGLFNIKAPHYLLFGSEEIPGAEENIGFVGQQMDLFFSANGLGSCWLGASKPKEEKTELPYVICLAFGKPAEPLHREYANFKRKALSEISQGLDERLQSARLAPSGLNAQAWYFVAEEGKIHCYVKKASALTNFALGKMRLIDMGIAVCHIAQASESFAFEKLSNVKEISGHIYVGSVV